MLCDICGSREATFHKTAPNADVSTVSGKPMSMRHYCTTCFEKTFQKVEQSEEPDQERETPQNIA
jgi:hypothetical protein